MALTASLVTLAATSTAQVALSDRPVFTSVNVPGNLALALSVEFPTAISVAHPDRNYSSAQTYIGYFDPTKCYSYSYTDGTGTNNYFFPDGVANNRTCPGTGTGAGNGPGRWSGNFLNWASMQTIDPFRWALTGGYRIYDTASLTVLEKAWASNQGSTNNFPDSTTKGSSVIAGATPFSNGSALTTRIWALGNKMRFVSPTASGANGASFTASYYNNTNVNGVAVATRPEGVINYNINNTWFPSPARTTNVSAKWSGRVTAPTAGNYRFRVRGDDGVRLTVQVNSGPTYSIGEAGWNAQAATNYDLPVPNVSANDTLNITVQYYQGTGGAEVSLQWQLPGAGNYKLVGEGDSADLYAESARHYNPTEALQNDRAYEVFMRVKVCDPAAPGGVEENCTLYGTNSYKPTGLMQKYSDKIRYSAFGYLNDDNINRDGGVLRAKQKFIGPMRPVPASDPVANALAEWSATTGVMLTNPDSADASATGVSNSGVMNYLNKFGQIPRAGETSPGGYKTFDPVGELYYAVQRYYRNKGNVPAWSNNATATQADGFPVITTWDDPVQYSCQRNFVLGIGDVNTHADRNLPGATGVSEPTKPDEVKNDTAVDAKTWTNRVGVLQGGDLDTTLGTTLGDTQNYGGCCNNNGALMAGLAYWANINDIRPDMAGDQTIQTYWLDVLEFGTYKKNNQFYLAAKFGGFKPEKGYLDSTATAAKFADTATTKSWWATTSDT
ncbi:pilus assembly protein, partial [Pelomonas sp. HMWF004]